LIDKLSQLCCNAYAIRLYNFEKKSLNETLTDRKIFLSKKIHQKIVYFISAKKNKKVVPEKTDNNFFVDFFRRTNETNSKTEKISVFCHIQISYLETSRLDLKSIL
jgi:hypothetical protein